MKPLWAFGLVLALAAQATAAPMLVATLLNPEANAAKRRAVVEVTLKDAVLQDPDQARGAHLLVQLDQETPIATAHTRISFHGLKPGAHTISIALVDADDKPLGAEDAVWLTVSAPSP